MQFYFLGGLQHCGGLSYDIKKAEPQQSIATAPSQVILPYYFVSMASLPKTASMQSAKAAFSFMGFPI